jgi:hypothetical protein
MDSRIACRLLLVCLLFSSFSLFAQNDRAGITGRVVDPSGAVVSGASIKITNTATGQVVGLTTSEDGNYTEPAVLLPGPYKVEASRAGFKTTSSDVLLQIGDVRQVNLTLTPGAATETVEVSAAAPLLQTETSSRGEVITGRQVTELPLNGLNFTDLATLAPGVNRAFIGTITDQSQFNGGDPNAGSVNGLGDSRGNTPAARFSRSGGSAISANGLRPTENNFTLDGVDNNEPQYQNIGVFPNPEAIEEFQVETSVAKADTGRGGATINTRYVSGTNQFHGKVYYFGQNDALNATPSLINAARGADLAGGITPPAQLKKTTVRINEFGGTLGGPIIKDRTFFFGDYLGQRNHIPNFFTDAVPTGTTGGTTGSRNGDFSAFCAAGFAGGLCKNLNQQLYDPETGNPFPNNVIPNLQSRADFSPQAFKILNMYPSPNIPNVLNPSNGNPNFEGTRNNQETIDSYDVKVDHRLFGDNQLSLRYSNSDQQRVRANFFPGLPTAGFGAGDEVGNTRQFTMSDTEPFTPSLLNELRFGYTRIEIGILNCGIGGACGTSATFCNDVGIPNCNKGTFATSGGLGLGFNDPGSVEFLGDNGPLLVTSYNFYVNDSVSFTKGKHSFKFGGEVRPRVLSTINNATPLKGQIGYAGDCCGIGKTGNAQAQALLSQNADFSAAGTNGDNDLPYELHNHEIGAFVQDDWKVTPTLTLNLGLRWDLFSPFTEATGRLANYDPTTGTLSVANGSGDPLVNGVYHNFGPRIGFAKAYGSNQQFVFRGGYGLFYTEDSLNVYPLIQNPPEAASINCGGPGCPPIVNLKTGPPVAVITNPPVITPSTALNILPKNAKTETVHEYNLTWEWQFSKDSVLDIAGVGTDSRNLVAARQLGSTANGLGSALTPTGQIMNSVIIDENRAVADYYSLQAHLEKRFSAGVVGGISYTWSHNIDNSTGIFNGPGDTRGNAGGPIDPFDFNVDRGNSSLDRRHVFVANAIIDLPFGRGKQFASNAGPVMDRVIGGWQLNTVINWQTGQPFSVDAQDSAGVNTYAMLVPGVNPYSNLPGQFLNPKAFLPPTQANGATCVNNLAGNQICFGDSRRNEFVGPGLFRTDMSLFKNVKFTERISMQLGIEFFNIFNADDHVIPVQEEFSSANTAFTGDPGFGRFFCGTGCGNAYPPRTGQYRVKIIF